MRFGLSADWHFAGYTQDRLIGSLPERLFALRNCIDSILITCKERKVDKLVVAGDILHGKSIIYALAQSVLIDLFGTHQDIEFFLIDGNHDLSGRGKDAVSALRGLSGRSNVNLISRVAEHWGQNGISFVPYSHDMVDLIKKGSSKYLISHFGLNEATLSSGVSIVSDLKLNDLIGKYQYVLLGHYHKPQEIEGKDIKLCYVGSPVQLDWGEKHEEKRFLIIDTDNDTIESIPTTGYKQYFEFKVTNENKEEVLNEARKAKAIGHEVRIFRDDVGVDVEDVADEFLIIDKAEKDITDRGIESSMSLDEKFKKYLEIKDIRTEDQEEYLKVGLRIVEKAAKEM